MKKVLSLVVVLAMVLSLGVPALAGHTDPNTCDPALCLDGCDFTAGVVCTDATCEDPVEEACGTCVITPSAGQPCTVGVAVTGSPEVPCTVTPNTPAVQCTTTPGTPAVQCTTTTGTPEVDCTATPGTPEVACTATPGGCNAGDCGDGACDWAAAVPPCVDGDCGDVACNYTPEVLGCVDGDCGDAACNFVAEIIGCDEGDCGDAACDFVAEVIGQPACDGTGNNALCVAAGNCDFVAGVAAAGFCTTPENCEDPVEVACEECEIGAGAGHTALCPNYLGEEGCCEDYPDCECEPCCEDYPDCECENGGGNVGTPCAACDIFPVGHPMNRDSVRNAAGRGDINWKTCQRTYLVQPHNFPGAVPAGSIVGTMTEWNLFTANPSAQLQIATVGSENFFGGQRFGASGTIRNYPLTATGQGGLRIVLEEIRGLNGYVQSPVVTGVWRRMGQADVVFALQFDCCRWHGRGVVARDTMQLPNTWRVDGLSNNGQGRLQRYLSDIVEMTGDASARLSLVPSDFTWRIPTREFYGQNNNAAGFRNNVEWADAAELIGSGAFATYDTYAALRNIHFDRVSLRTSRAVNMSGTIYDVTLHWDNNGQNMAIRIRTPRYMVRTGTTTVEFDVNFAITGGRSQSAGRAVIDVANTRVYVYEGDDHVAPHHTEYLRGAEHVRAVEIYAGVGVYFTRNLTARHSIYVQASLVTHDAWDDLFVQHAELVDIIKVWETGMRHAASQVRIDRDNTYFVYDSEFRLIGTTADTNLPFSPYYFLTTAQVDLGTGTAGPDVPGPELDIDVPLTGGDGGPGTGASNNVNMNPGTGL